MDAYEQAMTMLQEARNLHKDMEHRAANIKRQEAEAVLVTAIYDENNALTFDSPQWKEFSTASDEFYSKDLVYYLY